MPHLGCPEATHPIGAARSSAGVTKPRWDDWYARVRPTTSAAETGASSTPATTASSGSADSTGSSDGASTGSSATAATAATAGTRVPIMCTKRARLSADTRCAQPWNGTRPSSLSSAYPPAPRRSAPGMPRSATLSSGGRLKHQARAKLVDERCPEQSATGVHWLPGAARCWGRCMTRRC